MYNVRGSLSFNNRSLIYIISCKNCRDVYVGSTTDFKTRFKFHKSDIETKKGKCGTARHLHNKCFIKPYNHPHIFLRIQSIESLQSDANLEGSLWGREKYWRYQLFTNTHGMNSVFDLYSTKRRGCRKN